MRQMLHHPGKSIQGFGFFDAASDKKILVFYLAPIFLEVFFIFSVSFDQLDMANIAVFLSTYLSIRVTCAMLDLSYNSQ